MVTRLLDRQVRLLEYLTSSGAIFGDEGDAPLDQTLQGIDRGLLRLEACHSHEKRMAKIAAVFPRTFKMLGVDQTALLRAFVKECPSTDISRLENARQFYDFLCARWGNDPVEPPYLRDVAACEFACAKVRGGTTTQSLEAAEGEPAPRDGIRRHPDVILLNCAYDIRPIFDSGSAQSTPVRRDTSLAIAVPPEAEQPNVFELLPFVVEVLTALDDWTERSAFGSTPEVDAFFRDLARNGLLEVRW